MDLGAELWLENQGGWGVQTELEGRPFRLIDAPGRVRSRPDVRKIRERLGEECRCHMEARALWAVPGFFTHVLLLGASRRVAVPDLLMVKARLGEALSLSQEEGSGVTLSEQVLGAWPGPGPLPVDPGFQVLEEPGGPGGLQCLGLAESRPEHRGQASGLPVCLLRASQGPRSGPSPWAFRPYLPGHSPSLCLRRPSWPFVGRTHIWLRR